MSILFGESTCICEESVKNTEDTDEIKKNCDTFSVICSVRNIIFKCITNFTGTLRPTCVFALPSDDFSLFLGGLKHPILF